jgi:hypothetical protein
LKLYGFGALHPPSGISYIGSSGRGLNRIRLVDRLRTVTLARERIPSSVFAISLRRISLQTVCNQNRICARKFQFCRLRLERKLILISKFLFSGAEKIEAEIRASPQVPPPPVPLSAQMPAFEPLKITSAALV